MGVEQENEQDYCYSFYTSPYSGGKPNIIRCPIYGPDSNNKFQEFYATQLPVTAGYRDLAVSGNGRYLWGITADGHLIVYDLHEVTNIMTQRINRYRCSRHNFKRVVANINNGILFVQDAGNNDYWYRLNGNYVFNQMKNNCLATPQVLNMDIGLRSRWTGTTPYSIGHYKHFVPTNFNAPDLTPSGLSVLSLKTKTGLLRDGASSCIPPESVKIKYDLSIAKTNCWYCIGSDKITFLQSNLNTSDNISIQFISSYFKKSVSHHSQRKLQFPKRIKI